MVHALREVHRVLAAGGILVDARPNLRVLAYAERRSGRGFQVFGAVNTNNAEHIQDRASDLAIANVVGARLFRHRRRGRFWYRIPFNNLSELRQYLGEHPSFVHRARWVVDEATRRRYADSEFVIRRPVRYELLEKSRVSRPR